MVSISLPPLFGVCLVGAMENVMQVSVVHLLERRRAVEMPDLAPDLTRLGALRSVRIASV
jgi:hypothetical protein